MKKLIQKKYLYLLLILGFAASVEAQTYPSQNISLLSQANPETMLGWYGYGTKYSSVYGWANPVDNREYAILGGSSGTYFYDVTNPSSPVLSDFVPALPNNALWREFKTYQNYAYLVSDDGGSKLQIVDMSYLPDSVHIVHNSNTIFSRSHTIYVEGNKLWCGSVTRTSPSTFYSMAVYDLSNPASPVLLRSLNQDYPSIGHVHDMYVRNDTVYASCGNDGFYIFKYNSGSNNFTQLASLTVYPHSGYNHSSDLTPNGNYLVFADEVPANLKLKIMDVSDFSNLTVVDTFMSNNGATPHNPYIISDEKVMISYYADGVYVFDISNPSQVVSTGFFDTEPNSGPSNNYAPNSYRGCWATYPWLPSGIILASDMQTGLFVLDASAALSVKSENISNSISIYPNPGSNNFNVNVISQNSETLELQLFDVNGKVVLKQTEKTLPGVNRLYLNTENISSGLYILKCLGNQSNFNQKLIIEK